MLNPASVCVPAALSLDSDEFQGMSGSLGIIFKAIDERITNLEGMFHLCEAGAPSEMSSAVFKSTSMNVRERLGQVAFGMVRFHRIHVESMCLTSALVPILVRRIPARPHQQHQSLV